MSTKITVTHHQSPVGRLSLATVAGKLVHLDFEDNDDRLKTIQNRRFKNPDWQMGSGDVPPSVIAWLDDYFAGRVGPLPMADIDMIGTDFQKSVWAALTDIPSGRCLSYGVLADQLGNPRAVRAVARANALNPVSIIVPCHRVIGANGTLTGYAGGLERKQWLLNHEAAILARAA